MRRLLFVFCFIASLFFIFKLENCFFQDYLKNFNHYRYPYLKLQNWPNKNFGGLDRVSIAIEVNPAVNLTADREKGSLRLEVNNDTIFNPVTLEKVWQIANQLSFTKGIKAGSVVSLLMGTGLPKREEEVIALKEKILENPIFYWPILSKDFKTTLIMADFESGVSWQRIFEVLQETKKKYEDKNHTIYISGWPIMQKWLNLYLLRTSTLFLISILIIPLFFMYFIK